jgi:MoaA/NifB/PqqE/SkfB family radical SAM enzyme
MTTPFGSLGINDGKGFVFVSHIGNIQPSGFLPLTAGNVRKDELLEVYRRSQLFRERAIPACPRASTVGANSRPSAAARAPAPAR